jgi:hypothetical protein
MNHDLSFWEEPDWRRESTVSPVFLGIVVISLLLVSLLAYMSYIFTGNIGRRAELNRIAGENLKIADRAEEIKEEKKMVNLWQSHLDALKEQSAKAMVWSRQFEALQSMVPEEIVFSQLSLRSEEARDESGPRSKEKETKYRYVLTLIGTAFGPESQRAITRFSEQLVFHPEIDRYLQNRELKNISETSDTLGTRFTLICTYEPMG